MIKTRLKENLIITQGTLSFKQIIYKMGTFWRSGVLLIQFLENFPNLILLIF